MIIVYFWFLENQHLMRRQFHDQKFKRTKTSSEKATTKRFVLITSETFCLLGCSERNRGSLSNDVLWFYARGNRSLLRVKTRVISELFLNRGAIAFTS